MVAGEIQNTTTTTCTAQEYVAMSCDRQLCHVICNLKINLRFCFLPPGDTGVLRPSPAPVHRAGSLSRHGDLPRYKLHAIWGSSPAQLVYTQAAHVQ